MASSNVNIKRAGSRLRGFNVRAIRARVREKEEAEGLRVLILCKSSLMAQAVEAFLKHSTKFQVMGLDLDQPKLEEQISTLRPVVILVDANDLQEQGERVLHRLLSACPEAKIIYMHAAQNYADIYHKRRVEIARAADLIRAIASY